MNISTNSNNMDLTSLKNTAALVRSQRSSEVRLQVVFNRKTGMFRCYENVGCGSYVPADSCEVNVPLPLSRRSVTAQSLADATAEAIEIHDLLSTELTF